MKEESKPVSSRSLLKAFVKLTKSSSVIYLFLFFHVIFISILLMDINIYALGFYHEQSSDKKSPGTGEHFSSSIAYPGSVLSKKYLGKNMINKVINDKIKEMRDNLKYELENIDETSANQAQFNHYYGLLHSHTGYSDGTGTPDKAFTYARDMAKLDFFAVTDHSDLFDNDLRWEKSEEWKKAKEIADIYNEDGKFVAITGFEMTWDNGNGHINTFNTNWFESRNNDHIDLKTFYNMISEDPSSISQWNHPNSYFGYFKNFAYYSKETDKVINLIEVANGSGPIKGKHYMQCYDFYYKALDKGWHVAPTINQDNHGENWGIANDVRTVVLAPFLNRDEIFKAIKERRVYATEDKNLKLMYTANGRIMGSILEKPADIEINIRVTDGDEKDKVARIEVISKGGTVVKSKFFESNDIRWSFKLNPVNRYYYVKVIQADGDFAFSAPIWTGK